MGCDHAGTFFKFALSRALQAVFYRHSASAPLGLTARWPNASSPVGGFKPLEAGLYHRDLLIDLPDRLAEIQPGLSLEVDRQLPPMHAQILKRLLIVQLNEGVDDQLDCF
jgi:hypothetical protein